LIGFDYGLKPRFMVIGDFEYPNLIHEAKPVAMGYGILPYFGLLVDPLFVSIMFENEDKGRECFKHFKNWAEGSNDGDAVSLSFIETKKGGYAVCVYPESRLLIDRCVPKYLQDEVSQLIMTATSFPLTVDKISSHYLFFKTKSEGKAFVFCGASRTGELFLESAIIKRTVGFFDENEIPEHAHESAYLHRDSIRKGKNYHHKKSPPKEPPESVYKRRWKRLRTFLPITIEKLNYLNKFETSKAVLLSKGFASWQVLQAACNIVVSKRMCNKAHFEGLEKKSAQVDILEFLLNTFEKPNDDFPSEETFSEKTLRDQIIADSNELLKYYDTKPPKGSVDVILRTLRKKGMLSTYE
jgi:hypothetical protein